ncbi:LacI family DNA-binding transcriptional regulator [Promicromonospora sp. NPDC057488]|uniref:LacI family DNA-binding transcriptional regulator n=1 Tax=Promicromonospora sp. NPDC057488 TaxID=3346147 RepID=UPI00366BA965
MVSIYDVAHQAGVSSTTVSNYLNRPHKVARDTSARIGMVIDRLGYVPSRSARQLRWGRSGIVGICVGDTSHPHTAELVRAAERVLDEAGLAVVVGSSGGSADQQTKLLDLFEELRLDGVLVAPSGPVDSLARTRPRGTPLVLLDRDDPAGSIPGVGVDHTAGGGAVAAHLLARGRRRLWLATGPRGTGPAQQQEEGFLSRVTAARGARATVVRSPAPGVESGRDLGRRIAGLPPGERPDGIFATDDTHALGLQHALLSAGIAVPADTALVGYGDSPFATCAAVPLSSVRHGGEAVGAAAAELLLAGLGAAATTTAPAGSPARLAPSLVVRESSAA